MSTRTALNKKLIMRRVTDRYPSHAQTQHRLLLLTTHSDITAHFLHERREFALRVPALADALALPKRRARFLVL
jgi:hypothetical protein